MRSKIKNPYRGTYRVEVISIPEELDYLNELPLELKYILKTHPEYTLRLKKILSSGKAIGVRTLLKTPEHILKAIHTVSVHAQKNYIITWLPSLLKNKHLPRLLPVDEEAAEKHKENIQEAIAVILKDRLRFKRLVLVDEENIGITNEEQRLMNELSELLYPLSIEYSVFRVIADNAHERTKIAQSIIKALLIIGPIAHVLEKFIAGVGKIFAASADDLLGESAELMALRGSGFSWKELRRRSKILIPVFALATWGAFSVHGLIENNKILLGGAVFGFSAVALSLTTAIQSIFMYRKNLLSLIKENKVAPAYAAEPMKTALRQDFTNPARLGLFLGASLAPVTGMGAALLGLMDNGWVLAGIGSTESIVAGLTVLLANKVNEWRFRRNLRRRLGE